VDWYEWSEEALQKAKAEDKPILVSIGYSSCHWCHVMERESFEKENIAALMNEYFVCIKVDREERPDIDQIYMEAVQAMSQHGGWPLNVFLTPDQKPFYGGTYFPPQPWAQLLTQVAKTFQARRQEIDQSADELTRHLQTTDLQRFAKATQPGFEPSSLDQMFSIIEKKFDRRWGGIEKAPKFVMPTVWLFLLRYFYISKKREPLELVTFTLNQMAKAGLYDQLGGGFARYSVDAEWFAPHFEKMLYDNAQLLSLYSEAYSITQNDRFKNIVYETIGWLQREMSGSEGGFFSALDADSEGVEGKFYTWTYEELTQALGDDLPRVMEHYNLTAEGNWEHGMNILSIGNVPADHVITEARKKMIAFREKKVRPGLDDKILTGWNAMTIKGLTDAYKTFGDDLFLEMAEKAATFIEKNLTEGGKVFRAFKTKHSATEGFLEDYAFLIRAYYSLYEVTFNESYLSKAEYWTELVIENFYDEEEKYFHFTSSKAEKLIAKKKEVFDNVIPSSNSVMAQNLFHLGTLLDKEEWKKMATDMVGSLSQIISSEPVYMSNWGILLSEMIHGLHEVVIAGKDAFQKRKELSENFIPFALTLGTTGKSSLPLLEGREAKDGKTFIYICKNKTCQLPVEKTEEALKQL
jgi:uncharacterized protein YyaL (SSP411 family)